MTDFDHSAFDALFDRFADSPMLTTIQLARPRPDFWLFSGSASADRYAIVMNYDSDGVPQRFEYRDDPDTMSDLHDAASEAISTAAPLNVYLATSD